MKYFSNFEHSLYNKESMDIIQVIIFIIIIVAAIVQQISKTGKEKKTPSPKKVLADIFPEIEQERLLYITSALYYGIGEIQNLEKQGQMLITPQTKFRMRRVKTRSESGGDDFWGTCRSIYSAVAPYVVGTLLKWAK